MQLLPSQKLGGSFDPLGGVGGAPATPPTAFTLTDIASGRLFQRAIGQTSGSVRASGTYTGGAPSAIEMQVLKVSDNSVVKDWTAATATIGSGSWSASLAGVAQGGSYYVKARPSNATGLAKSGSHPFFVGIMITLYGQSNMVYLSQKTDGSPPAAASGTTYFDGTNWTAVPAANGIRELLNGIASGSSGVPVAAMNGAVSGQSIGALMQSAGTGYFEAMAAQMQAVGDSELILWHQGEGNAAGAGAGIATYPTSQSTLHSQLCAVVGRTKAQMPFILATLGNTTDSATTDANWDAMQASIIACAANSNTYLSHSNMDAVREVGDVYHYNGTSQGRAGKRYAQSALTVLGYSSGFPRSAIVSSATVDATHTDVTMAHALGTDFTPTSGVTGFQVSGDNGSSWAAPSAADRASATVIRLTHASIATNSARKLRYQYGCLPDFSAPLLNNGSVAGPLLMSAGVLSPTPLAASPVPTYRTNVAITTGINSASISQAGVNIVNAAADLLLVMGYIGGSGVNLTAATVTPSGGSAITGTVRKSTATSGTTAFATFAVPNGTDLTNATVALTLSGAIFSQPRVSFWTCPQSDLSSLTPVDVQEAHSASAQTVTVNLATTSGGFTLAVARSGNITSNTCTWSGTDTPAKRFDIIFSSAEMSGGDTSGTATNASYAVTPTFAGTAAALSCTAISFR